jgi:Zn-dependent metalloprotease
MRKTILALSILLSVSAFASHNPKFLDDFYYTYSEQQQCMWSGVLVDHQGEKAFMEWLIVDHLKNPGITFELVRTLTDPIGNTHKRYQQFYNGIEVKHGVFNLHFQNGLVESFNGEIYTQFESNEIGNTPTKEDLIAANSDAPRFETPSYPEISTRSLLAGTIIDIEEVVYYTDDLGVSRLSFPIHFRHSFTQREDIAYADAESLKILRSELQTIHADSTGKAVTHYRDTQTIVTDFQSNGRFRLRQENHPIAVYKTTRGNDVIDSDNFWNNSSERIAGDVMYGTTLFGDLMKDEFKWDSYDGNDDTMVAILNFAASGNATWNLGGNFATYYVNSTTTVGPCASLDVVGHEIGHGVADENAGLVYTGESCMLHESFADISGTMTERRGVPNKWDWVIGEQVWSGGIRDMSDPWNKSMPKYYQGKNWGGGCHSPGSVQSYWYYLMHHGDTGKNEAQYDFSIEGLGHKDAINVSFGAMFYYVTPQTDFKAMVKHTLKMAKDLFGTCSDKYTQVYEAWKVVGLEDTTMKGVDTRHGIVAPALLCNGPGAKVNLKSVGDVSRKITWYLQNGDSIVAQDTQITLAQTGRHTVMSKTEVCSFTFRDTAEIVVNYRPEPKFSLPQTAFCMHPTDSVFVTNNTVNADANIPLRYRWKITPSTIELNQRDFVFAKSIDYDFELKLEAYYEDGCKELAKEDITMFPLPKPDFSVNDGCTNESVKLINNTPDSKYISYSWWLPDGSVDTSATPTVISNQAGIKKVYMTATFRATGCSDSLTKTFESFKLPDADFAYTPGCLGEPMTFYDKSVYDEEKAWNEWDFGFYKPFNKDSVTYSPTTAGEVSIALRISDKLGCQNEITKKVPVEKLEAKFLLDQSYCERDSLIVKNISEGELDTVKWTLNGDSYDMNDLRVSNLKEGSLDLTLKISNERCKSEISLKSIVHPLPAIDLSITDGCSEDDFQFMNAAETTENTTHEWLYGNGGQSDQKAFEQVFEVDKTTVYNVRLTATSELGCVDVKEGSFTVSALPVCSFNSKHAGKKNRVVLQADSSEQGTYEWVLGDGSSIEGDSVEHTYDNDDRRIVKLTVTSPSGCICSDSFPINPLSLLTQNANMDRWKLYPNPSDGMIMIAGIQGPFEVHVYDNTGRLVYANEGELGQIKLDVADGIYSVLIRQDDLIEQKRIVID